MKALALIAGGALVYVALFAMASPTLGNVAAILIVMASSAGVVTLFFLDRARANKTVRLQQASDADRLRELFVRAQNGTAILAAEGPSGIGSAAMVVALAAAGLYAGFVGHNLLIGVISGLFLLSGFVLLTEAVRGSGRPKIELSSQGIRTAVSSLISWQSIDGIDFSRYGDSSRLVLQVPSLPKLIWEFSLKERILFWAFSWRFQDRFLISLDRIKANPAFVHAVARMLWYYATGRNYEWNSRWTREANSKAREWAEKHPFEPDIEWWIRMASPPPNPSLSEIEKRSRRAAEEIRAAGKVVDAAAGDVRRISAQEQVSSGAISKNLVAVDEKHWEKRSDELAQSFEEFARDTRRLRIKLVVFSLVVAIGLVIYAIFYRWAR